MTPEGWGGDIAEKGEASIHLPDPVEAKDATGNLPAEVIQQAGSAAVQIAEQKQRLRDGPLEGKPAIDELAVREIGGVFVVDNAASDERRTDQTTVAAPDCLPLDTGLSGNAYFDCHAATPSEPQMAPLGNVYEDSRAAKAPSPATFASESRKDRSGLHGSEVA